MMASRTVTIAGFAGLLGLAAPGAAAAQASPPAAAPNSGPAWELLCPGAGAGAAAQGAAAGAPAQPCSLVQNLVAGEQKQRLLTVIVQRQAKGGHGLTIALPHGVVFTPGVGVQIDDGAATTLAVQTSDANGAYTGTPVDAAMLAAMKTGKSLKVSFTAGNGQRILVPVTLKDFGAGLAELGKKPLPAAAKAN